ncbi:MAG: hypothetical protein UW75_C0016G0003 [Parcubacteria group bacterium GW2011_GWF2_44_8]|nr:MAG: hypothetical protein UW75_C0016G0003 [Parcubacteria group bacterium GW2011_GWF2_44_8]
MTNISKLLDRNTDSLDNIVLAEEFVVQRMIRNCSPFQPLPTLVVIKASIFLFFVKLLEKVAREKLYIKNAQRELHLVDSRLRTILNSLIAKNIVYGWDLLSNYPDAPAVIRYGVYLKLTGPVLGNTYNAEGFGVANDKNAALLIAVAEALERQSAYIWNPSVIVKGSFDTLKDTHNLVWMDLFSEKQKAEDEKMNVSKNSIVGWAPAVGIHNNKKYLLPAQMVYVLYGNENLKEPIFTDSSTSGVAAGASFEHAACQALCELVERDALMGFWLNKIPPPLIDPNTIESKDIRQKISTLKKYKFELYILDITSDIKIPTFCAVLRDPTGEVPVSMSAVADFDKNHALEKLILEISKFAHYRADENTYSKNGSDISNYLDIFTMPERRHVWTQKNMFHEIDFFLQGEKKDFSSIQDRKDILTYKKKLEEVKKLLKQKGMDGYLAEVTSKEANSVGLRVVRAVVPDLIPIHFSEKRKHLGVSRLYEFPVLLRISTERSSEDTINNTPHPFL